MAIFNFTPRRRDARQTAGRDLTGLLRAQREGTDAILGEVDEFGKRKRGADIMAQLAGMTPEERAKTDIMALGGSGTQSDQTMDILKGLAGEKEAQKGRDFTAEENAKNRAGAQTLAKLKSKLDKGEPLKPEEKIKIKDDLRKIDTTLAQLRGQWSSAREADKPAIKAEIEALSRDKREWEKKLDPKYGMGIATESFKNVMPGQREQAKATPTKTGKHGKKQTNIFGF